jgi:hypothetical protein
VSDDPIRDQRRRVHRAVKQAKRLGYLLLLGSIVAVAIGLTTDLTGTVTAVATGCLIAGAVVLGPAVILGYAVNAAEREDRAAGR